MRGGKNKGKAIYASPAKYAHLVELGTAHSVPKPFLRPALDANKGTSRIAFINVIRSAIDEETTKAKAGAAKIKA